MNLCNVCLEWPIIDVQIICTSCFANVGAIYFCVQGFLCGLRGNQLVTMLAPTKKEVLDWVAITIYFLIPYCYLTALLFVRRGDNLNVCPL